MTQPSTLWPEAEHMHKYLDQWVAYVRVLEERIRDILADFEAERLRYLSTIEDLQNRLENQVRPLRAEVDELRQQLRTAKAQVAALESERATTIERLAIAVEVPKNANWVTLDSLLIQAGYVIAESKKMVRENL